MRNRRAPRPPPSPQQIKDPSALSALAHAATAHATGGQLSPAQMRDLCVAFADLGFFDVGFKSAMAEGARRRPPTRPRPSAAASAGGARRGQRHPPQPFAARFAEPLVRASGASTQPTGHPLNLPAAASPPAPAAAIIPKLPAFEPAVLADTMYAYGQAQYYDFELLTVSATKGF